MRYYHQIYSISTISIFKYFSQLIDLCNKASISGLGLISTKKKGMGDVLGQGASVGASNAGDKIADYYLRQAEAMSPVLTVPSGVRVNAQIIKGFWMGETTTHKRIIQSRGEQK
jgi:hypothetical protein